jgi:hypothetical protein
VTGTVSEDEFGLLVVADPACVVVLPGELEDATPAPAASLAWNPAVAAASSSAMPGVDVSRRTSSTGHPTDLPTFLVVIALATVLMAVAVVASRSLLKRSGGRSDPVEAGPGEEEGPL